PPVATATLIPSAIHDLPSFGGPTSRVTPAGMRPGTAQVASGRSMLSNSFAVHATRRSPAVTLLPGLPFCCSDPLFAGNREVLPPVTALPAPGAGPVIAGPPCAVDRRRAPGNGR